MEYKVVNGVIQVYGIEIQAAEHCNIRCAGCSQGSPFLPPTFPVIEGISRSLSRLSGVLRAGRATILGGEPLLNPNLIELLSVVRHSGIFDRIYVTTNGVLLEHVAMAFWRLVDVVEISVYPATRRKLQAVMDHLYERACSSRTELHFLPTPTFRHITLTENIGDDRVIRDIYTRCYFRHFCHTLHNERLHKCAPSTHIPELVGRVGNTPPGNNDACIQIDDATNLRDRLTAFFHSDVPMEVCRFCVGSSGSEFAHRQLSASEVATPNHVRYSPNFVKNNEQEPNGSQMTCYQ